MRSRANTRVNEPTGSPGDDQRSSASEGRARHRGCPDRPCHIRRKQSISSCSTWGEPSRGDESSCVRQVAMSTSSGMRTARCSEANGWAATFGSRGRPGAVAVVARSFDRDAFHTAFVELRLRVRQVCRRTMEAAKLAGDPIPVGFVLVVNARSGPPRQAGVVMSPTRPQGGPPRRSGPCLRHAGCRQGRAEWPGSPWVRCSSFIPASRRCRRPSTRSWRTADSSSRNVVQ
jgi:hypothetical protein